MDLFDRKERPITDWRNWTRPKKEDGHWRAGRSAMELARAWFTSPVPVIPVEIESLLQSHPLIRNIVLRQGWPERVTPLPYRGEGRNHDLILLGEADGKSVLVAIEAKVDETMGPPIGRYWRKSKSTLRSRAWRRIDALLDSVFGAIANASEKPWNALPYQMLTATVGTAIEASRHRCDLGVLCIHEFVTESAKPRSLARNDTDFRAFLSALGEKKPSPGQLFGPFFMTISRNSAPFPVLIGKVQYDWAADKHTSLS